MAQIKIQNDLTMLTNGMALTSSYKNNLSIILCFTDFKKYDWLKNLHQPIGKLKMSIALIMLKFSF